MKCVARVQRRRSADGEDHNLGLTYRTQKSLYQRRRSADGEDHNRFRRVHYVARQVGQRRRSADGEDQTSAANIATFTTPANQSRVGDP